MTILNILGWISFLWGTLGFLVILFRDKKKAPHPLSACAVPLYWIIAAICWSHP